ncbi:putative pre-16S rRNA nuclease isoform X1, partial [Tanacetum coccineum]
NPFSAKTSLNWNQVIVEFGVGVGFILDFHKKGVEEHEDASKGVVEFGVVEFGVGAYRFVTGLEEHEDASKGRDVFNVSWNHDPTKMRYMKPLNLFENLLKFPAIERGRLLGLDVGDKYVGLAVFDFNNKVASPLRQLSEATAMGSDVVIMLCYTCGAKDYRTCAGADAVDEIKVALGKHANVGCPLPVLG